MLSRHGAVLIQVMHEPMIQQVNGGEKRLGKPVGWLENLSSIGYILSGELNKEHVARENFLEGMVKSHKAGPEI